MMEKTENRHAAKPLSGLAKRRKQPERYAQFALKIVGKILYKIIPENKLTKL
jgi:hypothetical protein